MVLSICPLRFQEYNFNHITSSPRHPQAHGDYISNAIDNCSDPYLHGTSQAHRTTPLENGYSPAELQMGRKFSTASDQGHVDAPPLSSLH